MNRQSPRLNGGFRCCHDKRTSVNASVCCATTSGCANSKSKGQECLRKTNHCGAPQPFINTPWPTRTHLVGGSVLSKTQPSLAASREWRAHIQQVQLGVLIQAHSVLNHHLAWTIPR